MNVHLIGYQIDKIIPDSQEEPGFLLSQLHFKVQGEDIRESPLHKLPELLQLLVAKGLNSYTIAFILNKHDRFDVEINAKYPPIVIKKAKSLEGTEPVEQTHYYSVMSTYEKIKRFMSLFQNLRTATAINSKIEYGQFIRNLSNYYQKYSSWSDEELYAFPLIITESTKLYQALTPVAGRKKLLEDPDYIRVQEQSELIVSPIAASTEKPCPFDSASYYGKQGVYMGTYFFIALNYRPYGDSPFHVMLVPHSHTADLTTASEPQLFELEVLFHAVFKMTPLNPMHMRIIMNKHTSSFMTVSHMHINIILQPLWSFFITDILNQIRHSSRSQAGLLSAAEVAKNPLTIGEMQTKVKTIRQFLLPVLERVLHENYQRHGFFKPSRPILLQLNQKDESRCRIEAGM